MSGAVGSSGTDRKSASLLLLVLALLGFALVAPLPAGAAGGVGEVMGAGASVGQYSAGLPAAKRWCATGVYRSGTASCPFAINVADAWFSSGGARRLYGVYSPTTGRSYNLKCKYYQSKGYAKCQTGRAVVYVYSSAQAIDCGNDIWVSGNADCGFAGNVADEYYYSGGSSELYNVYWPNYDEYYDVSCSGYNPVTCWVTGSYVYIY